MYMRTIKKQFSFNNSITTEMQTKRDEELFHELEYDQ